MLKDTLEGAGFKNTTLENTTFENTLFADSMLETSWAERTRRNWMTMTSFGLQALMIGLLLLLPVLKTVGLPGSAHRVNANQHGTRWRGTCAHAEGWAGFQPSGPDLPWQVDGAHAHPIDYKNWARQFVPGSSGRTRRIWGRHRRNWPSGGHRRWDSQLTVQRDSARAAHTASAACARDSEVFIAGGESDSPRRTDLSSARQKRAHSRLGGARRSHQQGGYNR